MAQLPHRPQGYSRPSGAPGPKGRFKKPFLRRKVCRFCVDKISYIDFKNVNLLRNFISERGKIFSSRSTGVCSTHQRGLGSAIKRARDIAMLPFAVI
ncbi:MAG: 30S ribosomal protein S18 [Elusimicrobia bacterium]|nr:30S ribosomal protein S18 [Elusimicrobiota bacterium]OGR52260.1 MAG: 30S ribosomal protein S18 [Elusimicrobia bacterium GWA2_38_7]OGR80019.1 MAG: 30S ribosomal protein S18 [Elusimicrobia bacterium RIFCSPHIGHO2_02_FULL_39_36]OGR91186.1 MAG: 30S ribosomal protein S18 [Elusimicrobia bacterium RIFCSPLOWO2_02_FULL_39_32]OGS00154.1 MAG: 30S ribosomal protein S18 [Elusimicrobia bacterium RIFCSPLOWO2_12_FULL_39_28]